jgi:hypothetical protein
MSGGLKLIALLLLGAVCAGSGIVFLLSLGIAIPFLAEQFKNWLATGQWTMYPL